jgi:hypothetical protein
MKPTQIRRILTLTIPRPHTGGGTKSATTKGFIGYSWDAMFLLDAMQDIAQTQAYSKHPDYNAFWDGDAEMKLKRLEAWHAARVEDGWTFEHSGKSQPGTWRDLPEGPEEIQ